MPERKQVFAFRGPDDSLNGALIAPRKATRWAIELIGLTPIEESAEWVDVARLDIDEFVIAEHPLAEDGPVALRSPLQDDS